jgi:hypothetical protein
MQNRNEKIQHLKEPRMILQIAGGIVLAVVIIFSFMVLVVKAQETIDSIENKPKFFFISFTVILILILALLPALFPGAGH